MAQFNSPASLAGAAHRLRPAAVGGEGERGRVSPKSGNEREMAIDSGGGGGGRSGAKRQRVDEQVDRCVAVDADAVPVDRISALPDELRQRILTHLPLKDAIRTGAVARGWRNLWKGRWEHRASVEVHLRSCDDPRRELDALAREPRPRRRLDRFSLLVDTCKLKSSELRRFIEYAAECLVEDLHVETRRRTLRGQAQLPPAAVQPAPRAPLAPPHRHLQHVLQGRPAIPRSRSHSAPLSLNWPCAFHENDALCPSLLTLDLRHCEFGFLFYSVAMPPNLRSLTVVCCDGIAISKQYIINKFYNSLPKDLSGLNVLTINYNALRSRRPRRRRNSPSHRRPSTSPLPERPAGSPRGREDGGGGAFFPLFLSHAAPSPPPGDKLGRAAPLVTGGDHGLSGGGIEASWPDSILLFVDPAVLPRVEQVVSSMPNLSLHSLRELQLLMFEVEAANPADLYVFLKTCQCPNLERLFVQPIEGSTDEVTEEPSGDGLDNLLMVKFMNFNWCRAEVQLVSFLLRKASSLRKLLIVSPHVTLLDLPDVQEANLLLVKEALATGKIMLSKSDDATTQPYHSERLS
ncbi:hypothetical protein C2845_PM09G22010 [Panicum miliaceum]|uniref:F-box domain-containing protein n=1 Tax=Panicum miliaceum TaxID=4540 RepID=A0A3L6S179_PANMI|nr:hypothetical protein C2845_PM09G22010 [Panicum miliaceum]